MLVSGQGNDCWSPGIADGNPLKAPIGQQFPHSVCKQNEGGHGGPWCKSHEAPQRLDVVVSPIAKY